MVVRIRPVRDAGGMADPEQVDVVVIGLGVGGEEVAGRLAEAGLRVVGIERDLVGGECPYWGCVPTKMIIRAANALAEARRVDLLAGSSQTRPDWTPVARRIREEATDNWDDKVAVERFTGKGGIFVRGHGRLDGPGRVRVGEQVFQARHGIVVATGTMAVIPPLDGLAGTPYWTNRQAVELEKLPESLIVLGGGAIGLELSQALARFGVRVTVLEASDRILAIEEPEASEVVTAALEADGVEIRTGTRVERVRHVDGRFQVTAVGGGEFTGARLLIATGRRAPLDGLGLETVGVETGQRFLHVDDQMRVTDGVWAVGDVTGEGAFTHVAMYQASIVVADLLDHARHAEGATDASGAASVVGGAMGASSAVGGTVGAAGTSGSAGSVPHADYRALSRVTFTDPEVGVVGLTEKQARERGINVQVGYVSLPSSARGWIHKVGNEGCIKVIADADQGVLVGATSVGPAGGEVLSGLVVAVHAAVPISQLRHMIYAYPTFHRAVEDALRALK